MFTTKVKPHGLQFSQLNEKVSRPGVKHLTYIAYALPLELPGLTIQLTQVTQKTLCVIKVVEAKPFQLIIVNIHT